MSVILNIETATKVCSIAIGKKGELIDFIDILEDEYSHSEKLNLAVVELLSKNSLTLKEITAIAISEGPGSYTGLRIGTSTAKGFCYGNNIPLISVNTLEAMCHLTQIKKGIKIPVIDARRLEVFGGVFSEKNEQLKPNFNLIVENDSFENMEVEKYFFGNGAEKLKEIIGNNKNCHFIDNVHCSARGMVSISFDKFQMKDFVDTAYFEPNYGKEFYSVPSKK